MLSVYIVFSTCLDDDHTAMLHTLPHRLRLARLQVFHARDIRLKGESDKVDFLHLFFCDLQEAHSRVEARPRIAEEANSPVCGPVLPIPKVKMVASVGVSIFNEDPLNSLFRPQVGSVAENVNSTGLVPWTTRGVSTGTMPPSATR